MERHCGRFAFCRLFIFNVQIKYIVFLVSFKVCVADGAVSPKRIRPQPALAIALMANGGIDRTVHLGLPIGIDIVL